MVAGCCVEGFFLYICTLMGIITRLFIGFKCKKLRLCVKGSIGCKKKGVIGIGFLYMYIYIPTISYSPTDYFTRHNFPLGAAIHSSLPTQVGQ